MMPIRTRAILAALPLLAAGAPAFARTEIHPYIEAQQVLDWDISDGQTAPYTGVGAGVDITVDDRNFKGQLDYQYDHYFSWKNRYGDTDVHNGLASGLYQITPELNLTAEGIATRTRGSLVGASSGLLDGDFDNTQQVYAIEVGPSYAGRVGPLDVGANYRFGWAHAGYGGDVDLGPGQPVLDQDYNSTSHTATAHVGQAPHETGLGIGWTVKGGFVQDDVHFLGGRYVGKFVRGDLVKPLTPTLAAVGGVGYEWNRVSERQLLTDADGNAILDDRRRLQSDPGKPRQLIYDQDGLLWDVGVQWRPSPRLQLEVRGGRRYGEWAATGNLQWRPTRTSTVQVVAYNDITSFGGQLTGDLDGIGSGFASPSAIVPVGCVFGANGGAGGCNPALSSINGNFYRSRGVYGLYSYKAGRWTFGAGADYDHRRYLAANLGSATVDNFSGVHDDTVTVNGIVTRELSARSTVSGIAYVAWYNTSFLNTSSYTVYGATGNYTRTFGRHLTGEASISVYSGSSDAFDQDVVGQALLGVRYTL